MKEEDGYTVYLDEANNKRYFKGEKEDFYKFFESNGKDAILYEDTSPSKNEDKFKPKMYYLKKGINIATFIGSAYLAAILISDIENYNNRIIRYNEIVGIHKQIDFEVDDIKNYILQSEGENFSDEFKRKLTSSDKFFSDIMDAADPSRYYLLSKKLENINIKYFTDEEKTEEQKETVAGYYSVYTDLNSIHLREKTEYCTEHAVFHEFIHLLQDDNEYRYVREACAEMMTCEYYGKQSSAYPEARKRIAVLMEIIGPQTVFECNFKGDTSTFENKIKKHLNEEEATELLDLFKESPFYDENSEDTNKEIDELLSKMYENVYGKSMADDELINYIYDNNIDDYNITRSYFNSENVGIHKKFLHKDLVDVEKVDFEKMDKDGTKYICLYEEEISEEEYKNMKDKDNVNIRCNTADDYFCLGKKICKKDSDIEYTIEEAIDRNIVSNVKYNLIKRDFFDSYDELLKYKKDDWMVRIITKDGLEGMFDDNDGKPTFNYKVYDTIEAPSISEKFPNQISQSEEYTTISHTGKYTDQVIQLEEHTKNSHTGKCTNKGVK